MTWVQLQCCTLSNPWAPQAVRNQEWGKSFRLPKWQTKICRSTQLNHQCHCKLPAPLVWCKRWNTPSTALENSWTEWTQGKTSWVFGAEAACSFPQAPTSFEAEELELHHQCEGSGGSCCPPHISTRHGLDFSFHFHAIDSSHLNATFTFLLPELHWALFSPLGQSPEFVLILTQLFKALEPIPSSACKFNKHILNSIIQAKTRNLLDKFFQLNSELLSSFLAMVFQAVSYLFHNIWETSSFLHCGL